MWMDIGWGLYFQVVGTHKHYMSSSKFFLPLVVGTLKPSVTFVSLPLTPSHSHLALSHSPCFLSLPSCSLSLPLAPSSPPSALPPQRWWGPQNIVYHTSTLPWPLGVRGSKLGARGSELGGRGVRGARGSKRGASWEQREWAGSKGSKLGGTLGPIEVVGTQKHTPQSQLWPTSTQSIGASGSLGSLQKPSAALGLQSNSGALLPLLSLPPHSLSLLLTPWASLGSWDLPGASGSLGSLQKPLAALGLQSDSGALLPLLPLTPLAPLAPSCSSSPPEPPWAPETFLELQETLQTFRSLWQPLVFSQTQGPCSPYPPHPLLLPSHPKPS